MEETDELIRIFVQSVKTARRNGEKNEKRRTSNIQLPTPNVELPEDGR
jgi:hypothetical protein